MVERSTCRGNDSGTQIKKLNNKNIASKKSKKKREQNKKKAGAGGRVLCKVFFNIDLKTSLKDLKDHSYTAVVGVVSHDSYIDIPSEEFERLLEPGGLIADIKAMWKDLEKPQYIRKWQL